MNVIRIQIQCFRFSAGKIGKWKINWTCLVALLAVRRGLLLLDWRAGRTDKGIAHFRPTPEILAATVHPERVTKQARGHGYHVRDKHESHPGS